MSSTIADEPVFVDTNILVYAYDRAAGQKHLRAREVIADLWRSRTGVLSTQVLQEFYVTLPGKLSQPLDSQRAVRLITAFSAWTAHVNRPEDIVPGSEIAHREQLSFWDGLIVAAARRSGVPRILSEDFQAGRTIEGILIASPFD